MIISFAFGPWLINKLKSVQKQGQPIRDDGPASHLETKKGTPTMGGLMMLLSLTVATLLWADIKNTYVWVALLVTLFYGALGFVDDYLKVSKRNTKGLSGRIKLLGQFAAAAVAVVCIQYTAAPEYRQHLAVPFFKEMLLDLGWFYIVFAMLVIVGASNAVNLTDGLDGLAIGSITMVAGCFALISYLAGNMVFANYLQIHPVSGAGEIAVFCAAMIGSGIGFLWFNAPPAKIFMGDTGSLAFGGALGVIAVITKHELVLAIAGGLFVIEAISVILQVVSFKTRGKRIFKMAPIHHHFEKIGWKETTVVVRFWIISAIFVLLALSTLKLR
jgi:phospho-N-acetylmuramoyl-pentapeptide-transferase